MTPTKPKSEKREDSTPEKGDQSSWEHDRKSNDYYYDDTCGYAVFEDEADLESNEEEDALSGESKDQNLKPKT
jgi:hypothetical protein